MVESSGNAIYSRTNFLTGIFTSLGPSSNALTLESGVTTCKDLMLQCRCTPHFRQFDNVLFRYILTYLVTYIILPLELIRHYGFGICVRSS